MKFSFSTPENTKNLEPIIIRLDRDIELIRLIKPNNNPREFCYSGQPILDFDHRPSTSPQKRRGVYGCAPLYSLTGSDNSSPQGLATCIIQTYGVQGGIIECENDFVLLNAIDNLSLLDVTSKIGLLKAGAKLDTDTVSQPGNSKNLKRQYSQALSCFFYDNYKELDGVIYSVSYKQFNGLAITLYERAIDKIQHSRTIPFRQLKNYKSIQKLALDLGMNIV